MTKPTKEQAIERLQKVLGEISNLGFRTDESPEFQLWFRNARVTLQNTFGENSSQYIDFAGINFSPPVSYLRHAPEGRQSFSYGLRTASGFLQSMIEEIEEYWEDEAGALGDVVQISSVGQSAVMTDRVFVVHGRNQKARDALFAYLRAIGLQPLEWNEAVLATGKASPYIGEILNAAFSQAGAVVVLMTPDDEARLREPFVSANDPPHETELTGQARPNVIFEAGMAMGRDADRTVLIELGSLRPFSDIGGRHVIRLDDRTQRRQELAQRLQSAGCPVNLDGTDWHTAGDFDAALT